MNSRTFFFIFILFLSGAWFFWNKSLWPVPSSNQNQKDLLQKAPSPSSDNSNSNSNAFQKRPPSSPSSAPEITAPASLGGIDANGVSSKKAPSELNTKKCLSQWGGWSKLTPLVQEALHEPGHLPELSNFEFDGRTPNGAQRLQLRREGQGRFSSQFFALDEEDLPLPLGEKEFYDHYPEAWLNQIFQSHALKSQERTYVIATPTLETHLTLLSEGPGLTDRFRVLDLEIIRDGRVLACSEGSRQKTEKNHWTCTCR